MAKKKKPKLTKEYWKQISVEAAMERQSEEFAATEAELLAAYDEKTISEDAKARDEHISAEVMDEWKHLKRTAMATFPEGAKILGLTPQNRLVAIASCFGWSQSKIAAASGLTQQTVSRWLKRPDMQHFINEFNLRNGKSGVDILETSKSELEYLSIDFVKRLLKSPEDTEASLRLKLDASKWVFNLSRDRAEDGASSLKNVLDALKGMSQLVTPNQDEEEELFKVN